MQDAMIGAASDIRVCSTPPAVQTIFDGGEELGLDARVIRPYGVGGCGVAALAGAFVGV